MFVSNGFYFKSVIRDINAAAGIVLFGVSSRNNQAIIVAPKDATAPIRINQAKLFSFLASLHRVEILTLNSKLEVDHLFIPHFIITGVTVTF